MAPFSVCLFFGVTMWLFQWSLVSIEAVVVAVLYFNVILLAYGQSVAECEGAKGFSEGHVRAEG